ncbi:MAG: VirK/YbjX family protein [Burkholderiales bacterium]|nr:VirK/YbjX family protein [Burkholderiales bacterium]
MKQKLRYLFAGVQYRKPLMTLLEVSDSPALQCVRQDRPMVLVGTVIWPYICAAWEVPTRLEHLQAHYRIVDHLGAPLLFSVDEKLILARLDEMYDGLKIVLDQPQWFMREGGLTLNLFVGDFRAYSITFSFSGQLPDGITCLIGGLQGRDADEVNDLYRSLTGAAQGLRPRDLLLEILRMLCRYWKVQQIFAVRDSQRHHRHHYFGGDRVFDQDYDVIWQDRGGTLADDKLFYRLSVASQRRADSEIKSNKRSLYHRRYHLLDAIESEITTALPGLTPVRFKDL